ncbi:acyltransferase [Porphyromonas pogonae]|uniref:acyltransferase n=1 Tax=Porphyromonas pogonae TaxID=867595 RepID=UPI002E764BE8|nr:acyltransferase family protein [Porphyromonas pogonae]
MNAKRNIAIDTLRTIAIIMVITIHTCGQYVVESDVVDANYHIAAAFESIVQMGVPLFIMISGAFVLGRDEPWGTFYHKRLTHILYPLLFWLPANWIWVWIKNGSIEPLVNVFFKGQSFMHLWFLVMLIGLYLITPLLNEMLRRLTTAIRLWIATAAFLLIGIASHYYNYYYSTTPFFPFLFMDYIGYFLAGYTIRKYPPLRWGIPLIVIYTASVCGLYFIVACNNHIPKVFYVYDNLHPLIVTGSLVLYGLFYTSWGQNMKANILSRMHADVLGVYLIHLIILNIVTKAIVMTVPQVMNSALLSTIVRITFVYLISLLVIRLMKKLKIKHII